jgi:hypothetical protein
MSCHCATASMLDAKAEIPGGGVFMGTLTNDMKRIVCQQRLGYIATVCPDGTPNLSPKGTAGWDDDR